MTEIEPTGGCPEEVALEVARDGLTEFGSIHDSPDASLGSIILSLHCLQQVRERLGCSGARPNEAGQLVCPNTDTSRAAAARLIGAVPKNGIAMRLDEVNQYVSGRQDSAATGGSSKTGQYL